MQEIGTWTTSEGTVSATLTLESDDVNAQELPGWVSGALSGALGGAATGAAAGPWGALVGAAAGATIGGVAAATASQPPKTPPAGAPSVTPASPVSAPPSSAASPSPPASTAGAPGGGAQSNAILALQQFAAAVPALIQLVAASGATTKTAKPTELSDADGFAEFVSDENLGIDEWTSASDTEGAWTIP